MALGNKNKQYDTQLLIIEGESGKDGGKSVFNVKKKEDNEWKTVQSVTRFSGDFKSLKVARRYDENDPKQKAFIEKYGNNPYKVTLELVDYEAKETYRYSFNMRMSTRGLINRLINLKNGTNVEVSVSNTKDKGYENFFVTQDGQKVDWKYALEDYPKPREYKAKGGKTERDYEEQDEFFVKEINSFSLAPVSAVESVERVEPVKAGSGDEDEIPF